MFDQKRSKTSRWLCDRNIGEQNLRGNLKVQWHCKLTLSFPRLVLSTGRGSDSESDGPPHRKLPDVRKDDMSARRTSVSEPRTAMPFNQYLPNRSNQSGYVPMPLRKKKNDKEEGGRKSWSTATSPIGGDRPFRWVYTVCYIN